MPWGFVAAAAIGAVGSVVASGEQASGQKKAAQTQADMFNTINSQEQPFIQSGYKANDSLQKLMGLESGDPGGGLDNGYLTHQFSAADYEANKDPGYQFQLDTGAAATRNADTPGTGALSGAALKDLMGFNQGMAATGYQNAFNRFTTQQNNIFGRLSGIAGMGQNAASQVGTAGTSLGTGIAQAQAGAAASRAGGIASASSSVGNGISLASYLNGNSNNTFDNSQWAPETDYQAAAAGG